MALPNLHPSPAEVFALWVKRVLGCLALLVVEFALFLKVLARPPAWVGFALSPFVALSIWQLASKLTTREYFSLSFNPMVHNQRELADVLFSVGFSINLLWFLYHLYIWLPAEFR